MTRTPMTATRALSFFQNTSGWLLAAVGQGRTCECGACYLCAYYFVRDALAQEVLARGSAIQLLGDGKWLVCTEPESWPRGVSTPVLIIKAPAEEA